MAALPGLRAGRALLPVLSLVLVLAAIAWLNPRAISYFGFTLMLINVLRDEQPTHVAVAFDRSEPTFRHE